jgi:Uma2 family endonuclease
MAAVLTLPEQKVILRGVSWQTYERLLAEHVEQSGIRFTYSDGILEIMVLSGRHEKPNRTLALLVEVLAEELQMDVERFGSTTFKRADLSKGFEPDSCFYIQHLGAIHGQEEIDLTLDPPPDLVIEIDITSPSLNKLPLYAAVGVPEVWRYDGEHVFILRLEGQQYREAPHSAAFPLLTSAMATRLLMDSTQMRSTVWLRQLRDWVRSAGDLPGRGTGS